MNLAVKDISHNLLRFVLTAVGVGLLLLGAMSMTGLYRGIVRDALYVIDEVGTDLWIVQAGTQGPFAEVSSVPLSLTERVRTVPEVAQARAFSLTQKRFSVERRVVRSSILGLDYPDDRGGWLRLVEGRSITSARGEAIADRATGLRLGQRITLGNTTLLVVGVTDGFVDAFGNPMLVCALNDAVEINGYHSADAIELLRAQSADNGDTPVPTSAAWSRPGTGRSGTLEIGAVMATLHAGADPAAARKRMLEWGDVAVLDRTDQREAFLLGQLDRLRTQVLMFSALLVVISAVVVSLTIYMMTVEKLHQIALLKLIGARNRVVIGLILNQSLLIGAIAFAFASVGGRFLYPLFPRAVVQTPSDLALFAILTVVICVVGSALGIRKALGVNAQEVLA